MFQGAASPRSMPLPLPRRHAAVGLIKLKGALYRGRSGNRVVGPDGSDVRRVGRPESIILKIHEQTIARPNTVLPSIVVERCTLDAIDDQGIVAVVETILEAVWNVLAVFRTAECLAATSYLVSLSVLIYNIRAIVPWALDVREANVAQRQRWKSTRQG